MNKIYATLSIGLALVLIVINPSFSQQRTVEKTFPAGGTEMVSLDLKFGDTIRVEAWDRNKVSFRAVIEVNGGRLNDALLIDFEERESGLYVSADYDKELIKQGREKDCPDNNYSSYNWNDEGSRHVVCSRIVYEIMVPRKAEVRVESISADIELDGLQGPIQAKSISGFVDLGWSSRQGAELSMKTISGEVYSGLDNLRLNNHKGYASPVGYELRGTIGGGGPRVVLESISGNIFVRKGS